MDLLVVADASKQGHMVAHVTDAVSRFQMASLIPEKTSQSSDDGGSAGHGL